MDILAIILHLLRLKFEFRVVLPWFTNWFKKWTWLLPTICPKSEVYTEDKNHGMVPCLLMCTVIIFDNLMCSRIITRFFKTTFVEYFKPRSRIIQLTMFLNQQRMWEKICCSILVRIVHYFARYWSIRSFLFYATTKTIFLHYSRETSTNTCAWVALQHIMTI